MIKKLLSGKGIAAMAVITAVALALSIFILPDYSVETGTESEEVFLEGRQKIAVDWNIDSAYGEQDETAHHMGEAFLMEFVFQYQYDSVDLDTDSLRNISFKPFVVVRGTEPRITEREINDEVREARYSAYVRFVEVNPGNSYEMEESKVEYTFVRGGTQTKIDATPPYSFQVSTYCGLTPQTCEFRVLEDTLQDNTSMFVLILQIAGGLVLLAPLALLVLWARTREGRRNKDIDSETEELLELYERYVESPGEGDAGERLRVLQSLSYRLSQHFFGIHPLDFLLEGSEEREDEDTWQELQSALDARHKREGADVNDVRQATDAMKDIFGAEIKKHRKNYKKLIGFISRKRKER